MEETIKVKALSLTLNNIDNAKKYLKVANGYGTQYFGNFIPKNAIYGRLTKHIYIYCIDFKQFDIAHNYTLFDVYMMDTRKQDKFQKVLIRKHTPLYNILYAFIDYNNMYNIKVEYCLHMKDIIRDGKVVDTSIRKHKTGMNFVKTTIASKSSKKEIPLNCGEAIISHTMVTGFRTR